MPAWPAPPINENHSPFPRGCRGMSCGERGTGNPKDTPLMIGGTFRGVGHAAKATPQSMKKLDRAATVRERLRQSAGLPLPDGRGSDFCYFCGSCEEIGRAS